MSEKRYTTWTQFVKDWAQGAGVSYPCASTDPRCRADYEAWKEKNGMKPTRPRKAPGEPRRKYVRKDPNAPVVPKRKYVRKPKVDKMALSYILNPAPTDAQTKANRAAASARVKAMKAKNASKKGDVAWVNSWADYNGASSNYSSAAKPKRKYVRKPKTAMAESFGDKYPAVAARLRSKMPNALD